MLQCFNASMLQCFNASMLQCFNYLIFLPAALLFSTTTSAQNKVEFDPATGIITYNYDPCKDPCVVATNCSGVVELSNCYKNCDNSALTDKQWLACRTECRNKFSLKVDKTPISYRAIIEFRRSLIFNLGTITRFTIPSTGGFLPVFGNFSFTQQGPIFGETSFYCWRYVVVINYSDGTQCISPTTQPWVCNL